jgi:peptidyl-prolyl cis-trans isomerase D
MRLGWVLFVFATACGSPEPRSTSISLEENPAGRDVVATVNEVPIYSDCVKTQAEERGVSTRQALDDCIDFELLAQKAQTFLDADEVRRAHKNELVRAALRDGFEAPTADPEAIPSDWLKKNLWGQRKIRLKYDHPELRMVAHGLVYADGALPADHEKVIAARKVAEAWHAALRGRTELKAADLAAVVKATPKENKKRFEDNLLFAMDSRVDDNFKKIAFAMTKEGTVSEPVRSVFGYHVILLKDISEETHIAFEDAADELRVQIHDKWRITEFRRWMKNLIDEANIERHAELLANVRVDSSFRLESGAR